MGLSIGELFVNLGIKGSDKTIGALKNTQKGMKDLGSMSLEAKAGIVAAMYALERLFSSSGQAGTGLTNFNSLLGVSAKTIQQYQYAARQMGVSNQEVEGSFKSLQGVMSKTLLGEGAPKGMARLSQLTGAIGPKDIEQFMKSPELLIQRLQQYASTEKSAGLRNEVLKSFNLSDNMISAMVRGAFRPDVLKKAPIYNDRELGALDKANIAWSNLGVKIEMAIGRFNARHGGQLVSDISKIVVQVEKLAEAFVKLSEKLKFFQQLGNVFEGWSMLLGKVTEEVDNVSGVKKSETAGLSGIKLALKGAVGMLNDEIGQGRMFRGSEPLFKKGGFKEQIVPNISAPVKSGSEQNININQNLNFQHDGKDHAKNSESHKKAINHAFRQFNQGQVR